MTRKTLDRVLWLGGMGGAGKTTAARAIARKYDLHLYSVDSYTYAHGSGLPPGTRSLDEVWVHSTPEELAGWFNDVARRRFPQILEDLRQFPSDGAPILAEGPQLLPELVSPHVASPDRALFIAADHDLHRSLLVARGSGLVTLVSDGQRAFENRVVRDEILAEWMRQEVVKAGFTLVEVDRVEQTEPAVERHFLPTLSAWDSMGNRGDVAARRARENDARLRQWRAHAERMGDLSGEVAFACECARLACVETITLGLREAEERRSDGRPFIANAHSANLSYY